jgi:hypothetical protein
MTQDNEKTDKKNSVEENLTKEQQKEVKEIAEKLVNGTTQDQGNSVQNIANVNNKGHSQGQ